MVKRIGVISIIIEKKESVKILNNILSEFSEIILARNGLPLHKRNISILSLVIEATTDQLGALTGRIGRLNGVQVSSILSKIREEVKENDKNTIIS